MPSSTATHKIIYNNGFTQECTAETVRVLPIDNDGNMSKKYIEALFYNGDHDLDPLNFVVVLWIRDVGSVMSILSTPVV